jgi:hypothetical protein
MVLRKTIIIFLIKILYWCNTPAKCGIIINDSPTSFALAACNNVPILFKSSVLKQSAIPNDRILFSKSFQLPSLSNTTAYRFTNPAGVTFDGVVALFDDLLKSQISMTPQMPVAESSWFIGYSWRIIHVLNCTADNKPDAHIGWAFYSSSSVGDDSNVVISSSPSFVFLIVSSTTSGNNPPTRKRENKKNQSLTGISKRMVNNI